MNMTQQIIDCLRRTGLTAFMPGVHEGICVRPYCVVQLCSGTLSTPKGGCIRYRVHLYVPAASPEKLDELAESVRDALRAMESSGQLRLAEPRGAVVTDDSFRAACSWIDYVSYYCER